MLPYCTANGSLSLDPNGADGGLQGYEDFARRFGLIYIVVGFIFITICSFVLSVLCRPPLIQHSCYKLMTLSTVLDIVSLINNAVIPGIFSILNIHHCNSGIWVSYVTQQAMFVWLMYCCTSEILALNRMLEFANKKLGNFLFEGRRVYFWFLVAFSYAVAGTALVPNKFYFYNTYNGYFALYRLSGKFNLVHTVNNFFKLIFLTSAYPVMLFFMHRILKVDGSTKITPLQLKVSIQALAIAALADLTSITYVVVLNVSFGPNTEKYAGVIGELIWSSLHGGSGIIYMIMNNAVRRKLRAAFCMDVKISPLSEFTIENRTN
uniref:G_PROTEIN_RECEP_F1_2 domain-containing protein n=1 Tax=Steinernema glaseri TaxID=37863 RepID=A0A1I8AKB6_9BILA